MRILSRRNVLISASAVVAAGGASYFGCVFSDDPKVAGLKRLEVLLTQIFDPARVGTAVEEVFGQDAILETAMADPGFSDAVRIDCDVSRLSFLQDKSRQDFASGRIMVCDRFVLSRTEAIVAGLSVVS